MNNPKWGTILVFLLLFSFCFGCNNTHTSTSLYWFIEPNTESFVTNDLEKAQKEISFSLILPNYLPRDLSTQPSRIDGPLADAKYPNNLMDVVIVFKNASHIIALFEGRAGATYAPSDENFEYLRKSGISILEQKVTWTDPEYFFYDWTDDDVHCYVEIYGYSRDTNRKIIFSMIE